MIYLSVVQQIILIWASARIYFGYPACTVHLSHSIHHTVLSLFLGSLRSPALSTRLTQLVTVRTDKASSSYLLVAFQPSVVVSRIPSSFPLKHQTQNHRHKWIHVYCLFDYPSATRTNEPERRLTNIFKVSCVKFLCKNITEVKVNMRWLHYVYYLNTQHWKELVEYLVSLWLRFKWWRSAN